jgi:hypothetical protein
MDHVACMVEIRNTHTILFAKPEGKRPPVRITRRCKDNIKNDLNTTD